MILNDIYAQTGRLVYYLVLPLLRRLLKGTQRSYLAIICQGEVLLIKNSLSAQRWQLPGGGCSFSEKADEAARREVKEELGINIDVPLTACGSGLMATDRLGFSYQLFYCRVHIKPEIKRSRIEITNYVWQPLESLNQLRITPEILQALLTLI